MLASSVDALRKLTERLRNRRQASNEPAKGPNYVSSKTTAPSLSQLRGSTHAIINRKAAD
jgi:hypothetical protein